MSALRVKNQYTPLSPSINPAFLSFAKPYTYRQRFGKDSNIMENEFGAVGQGMNYLLGIGGIIVVFVIYAISLYNRLVALRQNRMNAYSDIDVQLKQRFDLVPQLVDSVKGYVTHEKTVLETVTAARASVGAAHGADQRLAAEGKLGGALMGLFAVAENYPQLKADQNFQQLMSELSDIENKIAAARRFFNNATSELNTAVQQFPANIVAGMFGFKTENFFEDTSVTRAELERAPSVKF
jgi:LemA protein